MKIGWLKKGTALLLAAAMTALLLAGCGGGGNSGGGDSGAASGGEEASSVGSIPAPTLDASRTSTANSDDLYDTVTIGLQDDPSDLSPGGYGAYSYMIVTREFYETLFDLRDNEYIPILAKGWTETDDLTWDVELYDYITDTDGKNITADDVVYSYDVMLASGKAVKYDYFESVEALDTYTVRFHWTKPIDSLGALEWPWCRTYIFSKESYEAGNFTQSPKGTGPYDVREYSVGSHLTLDAKEHYWQTPELQDELHRANVKTIVYDVINESSQHVISLSSGQIQYSQYVPGDNIPDFLDGGRYAGSNAVYITQGSALEVLMANNAEGKITADPNFRKALWYALDNDAIAAVAGTYLPSRAMGTPFFSDYDADWEADPDNYMNETDVAKAQEYLNQTAYNKEELILMGASDEASKAAMTMIQALLLNIGVNVRINALDGVLLEEDMLDPSTWDILYKDCGGGSQVGEWNRYTNYTEFGTGVNMAFIHDEELQSLYLAAASIEGHNKENMSAFHHYVLEQGYYYAAVSPQINAVYAPCFATLAYAEGEFFIPGACEYYLD